MLQIYFIMASQLASKQQQKNLKIGFIQKFAVQYYSSLIFFLVFWVLTINQQKPIYFFIFVMVAPYAGKLMPMDNLQIRNSQYHNRNIYHALPLVANILCSLVSVVILCLYFPYHHQTYLQRFISIYSFAVLTSPSIDAAHELIHRPQKVFRGIGFMAMTMFFFTVYPIEHLYLHHKEVGTERDPITSKKGQTIYAFVPKAYFSAHKFAFNYNKAIFFTCISMNLAYIIAIYFYAASKYEDSQMVWSMLSFFILGGLLGFATLQFIEYIEHYGLIIRKDADKMALSEQSSWNTDENMMHNWLVFRFQRHSDHHMNAYKFFTTMELTPTMPRFPMTFQDGIYMSLIPPLWFYIMNPYVNEQIENIKVSASHIKLTKIASQFVMWLWFCITGYLYYETVIAQGKQ